jgi:hypothetical protein
MTIWDLGLAMMHQVIGSLEWHIALMVQGFYTLLDLVQLAPSRSGLVWIVVQSMSKNNLGPSKFFCLFKPGLNCIPMVWVSYMELVRLKTVGPSIGKNFHP